MRAVFSVLGLLIVVAVIGVLARKQLGTGAISKGLPGVVLPASAAGATPQQQSELIGQQVRQTIDAAMQQPRPVTDDK